MLLRMICEQAHWMRKAIAQYNGAGLARIREALRFSNEVLKRFAVLIGRCLVVQYSYSTPPTSMLPAKIDVVALLLSHNRPGNMEFIVKSLLTLPEIKKVVVSNSNPKVRIREWIHVSDSRLDLIDEGVASLPGRRFIIASKYSSEFYLAIDDDYFLSPRQQRKLIQALIDAPNTPHGLRGCHFAQQEGRDCWIPTWLINPQAKNQEREVDSLIGVYAFTCTHLEQYFKFLPLLGITDPANVGCVDDFLISNTGQTKAVTHNFGFVLDCLSSFVGGVALFKSKADFDEERVNFYNLMKNHRLIPPNRLN